MKTSLLLLPLLLIGSLPAQASSTWRCDRNLVSLNDSTAIVQHKCGTPISQALVGYVERRDDYGFTHELAVEEWVYGPRNGMYHYLRFEGSRLTRIDSKRGQ
jgi:hypothetical protein